MTAAVVYSEQIGAIRTITLDRPHVLNAIDDALLEGLAEEFLAAARDPDCRVVILRGAGRVFCAGGDVADMPSLRTETDYRTRRLAAEQAVARAVRELDRPLVAQIHGAAIGGGCVLAALCDLRVAATDTRFSLPETAYGTTASLGGIFMLTRIVGLGRAFELLYLGERFTAERAFEIGLVNRVVDAIDLDAEVSRLATRLADQFPREMMLTRRAILDGLDLEFSLAARLETEAAMTAHLSGDVVEGFKRARVRMRASKGNHS